MTVSFAERITLRRVGPKFRGCAALAASLFMFSLLPACSGDPAGVASPPAVPQQSPIDIHTNQVVPKSPLSPLQFTFGTPVTLDVSNTGQTIHADVPSGAASVMVDGTTYHLLQFHFHHPSETRLDSQAFPMEMHLVFKDDQGKLLVVGVWVKRGAAHSELNKIFSTLPPHKDDHVSVSGFVLSRLLPAHYSSFRYMGSLTTPPFTEGVRWVMLKETITLSDAQIQTYNGVLPQANAREDQPLNGRVIQTAP